MELFRTKPLSRGGEERAWCEPAGLARLPRGEQCRWNEEEIDAEVAIIIEAMSEDRKAPEM